MRRTCAERQNGRLGGNYWRLFAANVTSNLGDGIGLVAYPWLASVVTRSGMLVALIAVVQRLPWLFFTLPAGVITDRVDRRRAMVAIDASRAVLTVALAVGVLAEQGRLPKSPDLVTGTRTGLYTLILAITLLLGIAEVLRDNSAQTILPSVVRPDRLEKANGRMWSAELTMNAFAGPPLGALLLGSALSLPIFADAASFAIAAALVATLPGRYRATASAGSEHAADRPRSSFRADLAEGVRWLWRHPLLRPMAIVLGLMNLAGMVSTSVLVLFAQEVLHIGPRLFAVIGFGGALGGIAGGAVASWASTRWGPGTCLAVVLAVLAIAPFMTGLVAVWPVTLAMFGVQATFGTLWNVITVSLRQALIPDHLLGRVNSVYRFFAWGMMPLGAALGGVVVLAVTAIAGRPTALRATWFVQAAILAALFVVGRRRLTTARIDAARAAAAADRDV